MNALDTMRALAAKGESRSCNAGDVIFAAGDSGTSMFGVLEGSVRLNWHTDAGTEGYELIEAGHVFGAGALVMSDHRRLGTAIAVTPCRLLEMNREKFLFAVQEAPMFAIELLASVDERLRDLKLKGQA
ncbi:MAG: cyclic nucleotide-binding domain-containing protein [Synechococcaceae bacterium WB9_4xC_028]|jgi:CRP/FNR family cyclic AMP-dependent transcriptional regulator|uniref:Crp/Fnr family transcriptional regulator n=1 Tax=unclassified Synechococcus TaxID=2626047 RepID=UPI00103C0FA4|nr:MULTISPECIES: cyclic nucleotide-binding domain-containing protein [unclassified Synechococcus]NDD45207.1 cyclic nucleotide-binding domain-containing protein [Synechococcaceae bacterium WB9_4xB_025]NDD68721.1 cyclic nucleotide-binding domain-containing protein [Synechococcaceae bacterium WB9_4xC_028]QNG26242.1 cyclic nucleotide-binding domain-containing protein [Synechococcus sp. HK01-R]TCD56411.1 cAMP-binding protein [Synechococcus sp. BS55D]